jgi:surfactin synthase thioesterase subunit
MKNKLFCFPYAGGSASFYKDWKTDGSLQVIPLEYPGHGSKYCESLCESMSELTDVLLEEIVTNYNITPLHHLSFFGHSMGATVAYEIAVKLEQRYSQKVENLFLSSKSSPNYKLEQMDCSNVTELKKTLKKIGGTSEELLTEDILQVFLPIMQADLTILANYCGGPKANQKLRSHTMLLVGSEDTVTKESMEAWDEYIEPIEGMQVLKGDHFYIRQNQDTVLKLVRNNISKRQNELLIM